MANSLALFDFDGTLTKRDTLFDFIIYSVGFPKTILGIILLPILISYKIGLYDNQKAKEKVIAYFFKGWDAKKFAEAGSDYSKNRLPKILKASGIDRLKWHINNGHDVAIVSASIEEWIVEWTNKLDIRLIATQLRKKEGILTGQFKTKNCHGAEKVNRIKELYNLNEYEYIYAYGDTSGDKEMLELADQSFYKSFK